MKVMTGQSQKCALFIFFPQSFKSCNLKVSLLLLRRMTFMFEVKKIWIGKIYHSHVLHNCHDHYLAFQFVGSQQISSATFFHFNSGEIFEPGIISRS